MPGPIPDTDKYSPVTFISIISLGLKKVMCPSVLFTIMATKQTTSRQPLTAPRILMLPFLVRHTHTGTHTNKHQIINLSLHTSLSLLCHITDDHLHHGSHMVSWLLLYHTTSLRTLPVAMQIGMSSFIYTGMPQIKSIRQIHCCH